MCTTRTDGGCTVVYQLIWPMINISSESQARVWSLDYDNDYGDDDDDDDDYDVLASDDILMAIMHYLW